jgi:hypothetical protein
MLRPEQMQLLEGTPSHWRFALTGGNDDTKRCFEDAWNSPGNGRTLESVHQINDNPGPTDRWKCRKLLGVGVITGVESNGLLVIDFDGVGSESVRAFHEHFRHSPRDLPETVANISGKKGRAKLYFQVPPPFWPQLEKRSASWRNKQGNVVLEAIWQNSTGHGRHAVIAGDHPHSSHQHPLYYRWVEGRGPTETLVAEAPDWLLLGILAQIEGGTHERTREERLRSGEDDATPWERLTTAERIELAESALPHCPNRLERGSGTYEKVRRIMCGVLNEFGPVLAELILTHSSWNEKNEWEINNDCAKTLASLAKSRVSDDHKARIASLFHFAREAGWQPPHWAIPPVEMKVAVENLKKLINQTLKNEGDKASIAMMYGKVRREFGIEPEVFRRLALEQFLGTVERNKARTLSEVMAAARKDNITDDVIDGFLGRRVHVLAGASHSGKTTLACFLANRVVHGLPVDMDRTRHTTSRQGRVLIFTSDCSDQDMVRELALEGIDGHNAGDRVRICSGTTFDDMLFICRTLEEFAPDLVIYDCLTSMMSDVDVKIADPAYADPIRLLVRHNGLAWPKCAHMILHHTTRDEPTRVSGTEQIKAACDEMWVYYPPELLKWRKGQPRPQIGPTRHLLLEKSRSGYEGRCLALTRNAYQGTWQMRRPDMSDRSPVERLTAAFREVQHDEWRIASEWRKELELEFKDRTLRRHLDQLVGTVLETSRRPSAITGRRDDTHYRPTQNIRDAARAMVTNNGEGINEV